MGGGCLLFTIYYWRYCKVQNGNQQASNDCSTLTLDSVDQRYTGRGDTAATPTVLQYTVLYYSILYCSTRLCQLLECTYVWNLT